MTEDNDSWVEDLIVLGIGALAVFFLAKVLSTNSDHDEITNCPFCGAQIKKWAIECPVCRRKLRGP